MKKTQNYSNHKRLDPLFHGIILLGSTIGAVLLLIGFIALLLINSRDLVHLPWFMVCIFVGVLLIAIWLVFMAWKIRAYALKNQDRIIRFEEGFRYYVLTGKQIDPSITLQQLIALRFASDEEFVTLCDTLTKGNTPTDIKKMIKKWRSDHYRI